LCAGHSQPGSCFHAAAVCRQGTSQRVGLSFHALLRKGGYPVRGQTTGPWVPFPPCASRSMCLSDCSRTYSVGRVLCFCFTPVVRVLAPVLRKAFPSPVVVRALVYPIPSTRFPVIISGTARVGHRPGVAAVPHPCQDPCIQRSCGCGGTADR
jgi:hypothetical protein